MTEDLYLFLTIPQHPNEEDISKFTQEIGLDMVVDQKYLWLVKTAMRESLPPSYYAVNDPSDKVYYIQVLDHPDWRAIDKLNDFNLDRTHYISDWSHPRVKEIYTKVKFCQRL